MTWDQEQKEAEARGEAKGELKKSLEIAHNMKENDEPMEKIISYTGLTAEQVAEA